MKISDRKIVIQHVPYSLDDNWADASIARPKAFNKAFSENQFEVLLVAGSPKERRQKIFQAITEIKENSSNIEFLYSESSSVPTNIASWRGSRRLQLGILDYWLFFQAKKNGIPTTLFFRDVKWKSSEFMSNRTTLIRQIIKILYLFDLMFYRYLIDILYVPTEQLKQMIPIFPQYKMRILPPGASPNILANKKYLNEFEIIGKDFDRYQLKFAYVGNFGSELYDMTLVPNILSENKDVFLMMNTPVQSENSNLLQQYHLNSNNISWTHFDSEAIGNLLNLADIGLLLYKPHPYRSVAFPVKLFEYCSNGLPVIANSNSLAGDYVEKHDFGWTCDYDKQEIANLISHILKNPEDLKTKSLNSKKFAEGQTWSNRVRQIEKDTKKSLQK